MFATVWEICILRRNSAGNALAGKTKDYVTEPVEGSAADDPIRSLLFCQVCIIHHILALSKPIWAAAATPPGTALQSVIYVYGDPMAERWVLSSHKLLGPWIQERREKKNTFLF